MKVIVPKLATLSETPMEIFWRSLGWDTSDTDMSDAFSGERLTIGCGLPNQVKESFNPDLSLWDTSSVTDFSQTFKDQSAFWGTGLKFWSVSHAEDF